MSSSGRQSSPRTRLISATSALETSVRNWLIGTCAHRGLKMVWSIPSSAQSAQMDASETVVEVADAEDDGAPAAVPTAGTLSAWRSTP
eukprot:2815937-Prymnesium_polylepis.1